LNRFTFREKLVASHFGLVLVAFFLVALLLERSLAADRATPTALRGD
jgi:hypothetical protein